MATLLTLLNLSRPKLFSVLLLTTFCSSGSDNTMQAIAWGVAEQSLSLGIRLRDSKGTPVIEVFAKSNVNQTLWESGFWPNHKVIISLESGIDAVLISSRFEQSGYRRKNTLISITPNTPQLVSSTIISQLLIFEPGMYSLKVCYEENLPDGWKGKLCSGIIGFNCILSEGAVGKKTIANVVVKESFDNMAPLKYHQEGGSEH